MQYLVNFHFQIISTYAKDPLAETEYTSKLEQGASLYSLKHNLKLHLMQKLWIIQLHFCMCVITVVLSYYFFVPFVGVIFRIIYLYISVTFLMIQPLRKFLWCIFHFIGWSICSKETFHCILWLCMFLWKRLINSFQFNSI